MVAFDRLVFEYVNNARAPQLCRLSAGERRLSTTAPRAVFTTMASGFIRKSRVRVELEACRA